MSRPPLLLTAWAVGVFVLTPLGVGQTAAQDHDDHAGHDHASHAEPAVQDDHASHAEPAAQDDHAGHDHASHAEPVAQDDHAGHDHAAHDDHSGHDDHAGHDDHRDEVRLSAEAVAAYGVRVAPTETRVLAATFAAPARIGFNRENMAHIGASVAGRATDIAARLGDRVAVDEVLLTVRSPELGGLQGDYLAAAAAVKATKPAVDIARSAYERAQELYDSTQGISLSVVQERATLLGVAERDAVRAGSTLTSAANVLRLHGMTDADLATLSGSERVEPAYTVRAPIAGTVIERHVTPGELVGPEDEALMMLADLSTVWALIDVPEARLGEVTIGSSVTLSLDAVATPVSAEVTYIDPRVNDLTRTGRLRVELPNPEGRLRPGMFARAMVTAGRAGRRGRPRCRSRPRDDAPGRGRHARRARRRGAGRRGKAQRLRTGRRRAEHLCAAAHHPRPAVGGLGRGERRAYCRSAGGGRGRVHSEGRAGQGRRETRALGKVRSSK